VLGSKYKSRIKAITMEFWMEFSGLHAMSITAGDLRLALVVNVGIGLLLALVVNVGIGLLLLLKDMTWDRRAPDRLLRMKLPKPNVPYLLVERGKLVQKLRREVERDEYFTMVLHGNRGCGKTNLLRLALEGRGGVLELRVCTPQDVDNFCTPRAGQLAAKLGISGGAYSPYSPYFRNVNATKALKTFKKIHGKNAVIVISLDETCTGVMLTSVLQECKRLGRDKYERHIRMIVNLSAVSAVHQTTRSLRTEMAETFHFA
jgi:hypothetical protein